MSIPARRMALAASIFLAVLGAGCRPPLAVATYEVTRREFTHRVIAEGVLVAGEATQVRIPAQVRHGGRILWMVDDGSEVTAGQVVMRLDHYELEQQLERELAELGSADADRRRISAEGRSAVDGAITRKDLAGLELEHAERFRRDDDQVFSRSEIVDSQIAEELARVRRGRAAELESIESGRSRALVDRVDVTRRVAGLEVDLARAALRSLELRAPRSGLLMWSRDWRGETTRIGEQVFRGQVVAEIPDLSGLEAEVYVLEADADGLAVGMPATITIEAHPDRTFGGRVTLVEPIARRRFRGSPAQYIGVVVELDAVDATLMKPGQRVTASIQILEEPAALVLPRVALFVEEGVYFVYVSRDGTFTRQNVGVRHLAPGVVLLDERLTEGLVEGDVVALAQPPTRDGGSTTQRAETG
jgi:multidrug resistance efflux pump